MCLLVIAWQVHPRYRLVVAANRDEFHERPTAPLARWDSPDEIIAGRDLRAGGTWLGVGPHRRFGVVTNFRELQRPAPSAPSRGDLVPDFLRAGVGAETYLAGLAAQAHTYSGFNLLLADGKSLWYASNRAERFARELSPGVYGLSNEFLDTPWAKLRRVRRGFDAWLAEAKARAAAGPDSQHEARARTDPSAPAGAVTTLESRIDPDAATGLFAILADRTQAGVDEKLPATGLSPEWEQILSAPFVNHPDYGTRCSSVLLLEPTGHLYLAERRFDAHGAPAGESELRLNAGEWR
jgi:uncharacterized protein with NRDE domain